MIRASPFPTVKNPPISNQVTVERKGIAEALLTKHLNDFEPPGADEDVLRYGLAEDAGSWVMKHLSR